MLTEVNIFYSLELFELTHGTAGGWSILENYHSFAEAKADYDKAIKNIYNSYRIKKHTGVNGYYTHEVIAERRA